jgi:hypothetical protein
MRRNFPFLLLALVAMGLAALAPFLCAHPTAQSKAGAAPPAVPAPAPPSADLTIKRLILKDGSYQPVKEFHVEGGRVRYLSAERDEWEEVPDSLVDWPATGKYARESAAGRPVSPEVPKLDAEEQAERKQEESLTPAVAPGIRLPSQGGVFLLDVFDGAARLTELAQTGGEVKRNTGRNVIRTTINPLSGQKQTIELKGQHARIQSHVSNPFLYIDVEEEPGSPASGTGADWKNRFRIVRLDSVPKKDVRVLGNIKVAVYGKISEQERFVPAKVEAFSGPWLKVSPVDPLEPGEYALAEILEDNQVNLNVWDFGVNPKAPANPD